MSQEIDFSFSCVLRPSVRKKIDSLFLGTCVVVVVVGAGEVSAVDGIDGAFYMFKFNGRVVTSLHVAVFTVFCIVIWLMLLYVKSAVFFTTVFQIINK